MERVIITDMVGDLIAVSPNDKIGTVITIEENTATGRLHTAGVLMSKEQLIKLAEAIAARIAELP